MYEMSIFEIEVLEFYNYSQLVLTQQQLKKAKKLNTSLYKTALSLGKVDEMVGFLKLIDTIDENLKTINVVMTNKEADCFNLEAPIEKFCLN